jgi:hypothetical protein
MASRACVLSGVKLFAIMPGFPDCIQLFGFLGLGFEGVGKVDVIGAGVAIRLP